MAVGRLVSKTVKECRLPNELLVTRRVNWIHLKILLTLLIACKPKNTNGDSGTSGPLVNDKSEQQ